jgi:murein DD-endopeptidase
VSTWTRNLAALLACALAGCSTLRAPPADFGTPAPPESSKGAAVAAAAAALVGTPYHVGGAELAGCDCSGLALYAYERAGLVIPRTAAAQQQAARHVALTALEPGDLVFFHLHGRSADHVGIYAGGGRFIHAPRAGRKVSYAQLRADYYARHVLGAGRFW